VRIIQHLIFPLVLTAVFFTGCETTRDIRYDREPAARLEAMRFGGVELDYATVLFDVEIDNPYPVSLPVPRLRYALVSEGRTFLTATVLDGITVPPNTKKVLTLPDQVTYARLLRALKSKPGSTIPFKAELTLSLDTPGSGWIDSHTENEGRIVLPVRPEIKVEGKTYNAVDVVYGRMIWYTTWAAGTAGLL